jgi:hypothetical protein
MAGSRSLGTDDENNGVIPGVLRYQVGDDGPHITSLLKTGDIQFVTTLHNDVYVD